MAEAALAVVSAIFRWKIADTPDFC